MKNTLVFIFSTCFALLLLNGCSSAHSLQFTISTEKAPFLVNEISNQSPPDLIIIASQEDIVPPLLGVEYSEAMISDLKDVDFSKQFVVMHVVGQIPDNGKITEVVRTGNTVRIKLSSYSVGPGNYMLKGFTLPYQITMINKEAGNWGRNINFILEVEDGDIFTETQHFIP